MDTWANIVKRGSNAAFKSVCSVRREEGKECPIPDDTDFSRTRGRGVPRSKPQAKPRPTVPAELTIENGQQSNYKGLTYPHVTEITWKAGILDPEILKAFPNVRKFSCISQGIDDIEALSCFPKLEILDCSHNSIVAIGALIACPELIEVYCHANQIISLTGLDGCLQLQKVNFNQNSLTTLDGLNSKKLVAVGFFQNKVRSLIPLQGCSQLCELNCSNNDILYLDGLEDSVRLQHIKCNNNSLTSIKPLRTCYDLTHIECCNNRLRDLAGLESKSKLKSVKAWQNKITSLADLASCPALRVLNVSNNKIRSTALLNSPPSNHPELTDLCVSNNCISKMIISAPKLQILQCDGNMIHTLDVTGCPVLGTINCGNNCIESIACLSHCNTLQTLCCRGNLLASLDGCQGLRNLTSLSCNSNYIENLKEIENCRRLTTLECVYNSITTIEHVIRLGHLQTFDYARNPLGPLSPQIQNFLHMVTERANMGGSIYTNAENVMNTAVTDSIRTSIQNLMRDPTPPAFSPSSALDLTIEALDMIARNCRDEGVHREFLVTYVQLLAYVWQRIQQSEHRAELISILEVQLSEGVGRCLQGRLARLVAVLAGFCDDISIAVSGPAQIYSIIQVTEKSLDPYDAATHRSLAEASLRDLDYDDAEIQPWLDAIYDPTEAIEV